MIYRITVDFAGIKKSPCLPFGFRCSLHLPHMWYDADRLRYCFCPGD